MRENRPYGSEGGVDQTIPTPIYTIVSEDPRFKENLPTVMSAMSEMLEDQQPEYARAYLGAAVMGTSTREMQAAVEKQYTLHLLERMGFLRIAE